MTSLRIADSFVDTYGSWFTISPEAALDGARRSPQRETIAFPDRRNSATICFQPPTPERLGHLAIIDTDGVNETLVASLPIPTRVLAASHKPSDVLARLCQRFGDSFVFARERSTLMIRISAETSREALGQLPSAPFQHNGRTFAPIALVDFFTPSRWECRLFCVIRISDLQTALADPDPWKQGGIAHLDTINGIYALLSDNVNCISNWGFYLFDRILEGENELRNKAGAIWLSGLLDSLEAEERSAARYGTLVKEHVLPHLAGVLAQAKAFFTCIRGILSLYTRDEQLFVRDFRDQLVHGWLGRRHTVAFNVKYLSAGSIQQVRMTRTDFEDIIRPFYETGPIDSVLADLLDRAFDQNLPYWRAVAELKATLPLIQDSMILGRVFPLPTLDAMGVTASDAT